MHNEFHSSSSSRVSWYDLKCAFPDRLLARACCVSRQLGSTSYRLDGVRIKKNQVTYTPLICNILRRFRVCRWKRHITRSQTSTRNDARPVAVLIGGWEKNIWPQLCRLFIKETYCVTLHETTKTAVNQFIIQISFKKKITAVLISLASTTCNNSGR